MLGHFIMIKNVKFEMVENHFMFFFFQILRQRIDNMSSHNCFYGVLKSSTKKNKQTFQTAAAKWCINNEAMIDIFIFGLSRQLWFPSD